MKNEVHFVSSAFTCMQPDASSAAPICFGDDVCGWLTRQLSERGHGAPSEPRRGDFCWYVTFRARGVEHDFFVRFVPENPSEGKEWRGWIERRTGYFGSVFGRRRWGVLAEAIRAVDDVLTSSTDIKGVEWRKPTYARKVAEVVCPNCGATVVAYRTIKGRILVTTSSGVVLAGVGAAIGAAIGIVTGGEGLPATIPLAAVGAVVGLGAGYIVSDKTLDRPKCPKCKKPIKIRFK